MDISDTLAPNSDQLDAVDLLGGSQVFTIADIKRVNGEQPVSIKLAEFDRPWMPGKSMRRVLASCWTAETSVWIGRRVELFCDPNVRFGGAAVGGIRIKSLSHIDKRKGVPLLVSRGKSAVYVVEPLREPERKAQPEQTPDEAWAAAEPKRSDAQSKMLFALLNKAGLTDRDEVLGWVSTVIGRELESTRNLTVSEASACIDALNAASTESGD